MKRSASILLCLLLVFLFGNNSLKAADDEQSSGKRIIVVFKAGTSEPDKAGILHNNNCSVIKGLPLINGVAARLPAQAAEQARQAVLSHLTVARIDDDLLIQAYVKPEKPGKPGDEEQPPPPEELPWGVDRIDADAAWSYGTGDNVKVAVLDTGISVTHPDLAGNIGGGINIISPLKSYNDDNGHGTHCAGIIAAIDNEIGVVGVANTALLYGVKVLNRKGTGYLSDIIDGLKWSIDNDMDVVSMSLGAAIDNLSFSEAIEATYAAGIVMVASAGNEAGAVGYPAAYPETIAVSATDSLDNLASFSNYGPEVDLAAPGVAIYSTYKGDTYKILSGTSMACPHVSGVAALIIEKHPDYSPDEVLDVLAATAEDIGLSDEAQGFGLVDAESASLY